MQEDRELQRKRSPHTQAVPREPHADVEKDARGQSETNHKGRANRSGVTSADPRVISGKESGDATFPIDPDEANDD